jgi:uncharacterized membrane protein
VEVLVKKIGGIIVKGLAAILPLALSIYLVYWLFVGTEELLRSAYLGVFPQSFYFPGLGIILAVLLLFAAGLLVQTFLVQWLLKLGERIINKIPLIKSIYTSINDFMQFVSSSAASDADKVVAISMENGSKLIGLVTSESLAEKFFDGDDAKRVGVFLPMSYNLGGYTIYVKKDQLEVLDIGVEEALRIILTGGVTAGGKQNQE